MFMDRHGGMHEPKDGAFVRYRKGAFVIIIINDCILVADGPHAPNVPELPGGGIEGDEDSLQAALRETVEETGFNIKKYEIKAEYKTHRKFYADDVDEYWNYDITYFHLQLPNDNLYFSGKIASPEGGNVWWLPLKDVISGVPFKKMERISLFEMGLI